MEEIISQGFEEMDLFVPSEASYLLFCTVVGLMQIRQNGYIGHQKIRTIDFNFLIIRIYAMSQAVEINFVQV